MVNKKIMIIVLITLIVLIAGCASSTLSKSSGNRISTIYYQDTDLVDYAIIHDDINKVTCYTYKQGYNGAGISCFTDKELMNNI